MNIAYSGRIAKFAFEVYKSKNGLFGVQIRKFSKDPEGRYVYSRVCDLGSNYQESLIKEGFKMTTFDKLFEELKVTPVGDTSNVASVFTRISEAERIRKALCKISSHILVDESMLK